MSKVDIIILSLANDETSFQITKRCVDSYLSTANDLIRQIFVIESYKDFNKNYNNPKVQVIIPPYEFNYNQFYNIGLSHCTAPYVMGPNNDLIIQENCIQNIIKEFETNPAVSSISPIDRDWHRHTKLYLPDDNKLYYGWDVSLHMFGCAFCARRTVFEKIGYLDEQFFFFYQDNDYIYSLRANNLLHGVLTSARIKHKSGATAAKGPARCEYTPYNMNTQGDILGRKWNSEPFKSGGYIPYKKYVM